MTFKSRCCLAVLFVLSGCGQTVGSRFIKSQRFQSQGGELTVSAADSTTLAGTRLEVPANALSQDVTITLEWSDSIADGELSAGPTLAWGPAGTRFSNKAFITMPVSLPLSDEEISVYVLEANGQSFEIPPADVAVVQSGFIRFAVDGFTRFQPIRRRRCMSDADCRMGQVCLNGRCRPQKACMTNQDCGPNQACLNGVCQGVCNGVTVPCDAGTPACQCTGPRPLAPNVMCADGSTGGPVCSPSPNDPSTCGWTIRACPTPTVDAGQPPAMCNGVNVPCDAGVSVCQCTGPAPGAPNYMCADGSIGGPVCAPSPNNPATCGWTIRGCPTPTVDAGPAMCNGVNVPCDGGMPAPCQCSGPRPAGNNYVCADGSTGGPVCALSMSSPNGCNWTVRMCTPCANPVNGACALDAGSAPRQCNANGDCPMGQQCVNGLCR
jgi:hypothetical protein